MTGSTTARGYGAAHQQERARWAPIVAAGQAVCAETYCYYPSRHITPGEPWELAHDHVGPRLYKGPSHRLCNRKERLIRHGYVEPPTTSRLEL